MNVDNYTKEQCHAVLVTISEASAVLQSAFGAPGNFTDWEQRTKKQVSRRLNELKHIDRARTARTAEAAGVAGVAGVAWETARAARGGHK